MVDEPVTSEALLGAVGSRDAVGALQEAGLGALDLDHRAAVAAHGRCVTRQRRGVGPQAPHGELGGTDGARVARQREVVGEAPEAHEADEAGGVGQTLIPLDLSHGEMPRHL